MRNNGNNYNYSLLRLRAWYGSERLGVQAANIRCMFTHRSDDDRTIADAIGRPAQAARLARNCLVPAADTLHARRAGCDAARSAGEHFAGRWPASAFGLPGVAV